MDDSHDSFSPEETECYLFKKLTKTKTRWLLLVAQIETCGWIMHFYINFSYVSVVSHRWNCVNNSQGSDNGIGALFHEEENILICFLHKKLGHHLINEKNEKKRVIRGNKRYLLSL